VAEAQHAAGTVRLAVLALATKVRSPLRTRALPLASALFLKELAYEEGRIAADLLEGAVREALVRAQAPVRTAAAFAERLEQGLPAVLRVHAEMAKIFLESVAAVARLAKRLEEERLPAETVESVNTQLAYLVYPGFVRLVPLAQLRHYARYLRGVEVRLDRARLSASGDASKEARFSPYWERYGQVRRQKRPVNGAALSAYRWMLEEYRISLFAQELRTPAPISPKRLEDQWATVVGGTEGEM
jgi:ATP-dependent helicase HrpA